MRRTSKHFIEVKKYVADTRRPVLRKRSQEARGSAAFGNWCSGVEKIDASQAPGQQRAEEVSARTK
jgi:hypothetical protein